MLHSLERLVDAYYRSIVRPEDRALLDFVFDPEPTQAKLDALLKVWDIEVAGSGKAMTLSHVQKAHPELDFGGYAGPRLKGLFIRNRFDNLRLIGHYTKIGRALNAAGIRPMIIKGGAMKLLRPEHPREMGDIDVVIRDKTDFAKACDLIKAMGYDWDVDLAVHSLDFHEPGTGVGVLDVHQYLDLRKVYDHSFMDGLFERAELVKAFGVETYLPCREDLLFIAMVNASKNLREKTSLGGILNTLFDVRWLGASRPDFDWGRVFGNVRYTGTEYSFLAVAYFIEKCVPGLLPPEVFDFCRSDSGFVDYCNAVYFEHDFKRDLQFRCKELRITRIFSSWEYFRTYFRDELHHQYLKFVEASPKRIARYLERHDKEFRYAH